jgi:hypothetical protein
MTVEASNQWEAEAKLKRMMDEKAIQKHWQEMHEGNGPIPSMRDVHRMIVTELIPSYATA